MQNDSLDTPAAPRVSRALPWHVRLWLRCTEPGPAAKTERERRDARLLAAVLVVLVPLYCVMSVASAHARVQPLGVGDLSMGLALGSAALVAYVLARQGRPRPAVALIVCIDLLGAFLVALREHDPMRAAASGGFGLLAVLYASHLASPQATLAALVGHLAATVLLGVLHPGLSAAGLVLPIAQALLLGSLMAVSAWMRERYQKQLDEREGKLRALLDASLDAIVATDAEGRVREWNGQATATFGWCRSEALGKELVALFFPAEAHAQVRALLAPSAGAPCKAELVARTKDGRTLPVELSSAPLQQAGRISRAVVLRDLSTSKRLQADLIQSDRLVSVGRLAQGIAHEINNPLAAVLSNLEYVVDCVGQVRAGRPLARDAEEVLEDMRGALRDVQGIVRDLRSLARGQDDVRGPLEVQSVLESAAQMAWNEVRHRARLVRDYRPVPAVEANEARLVQVFVNLLMNAAQALPAGGAAHHTILLSLGEEPDGRVRVQVEDSGAGIPPEVLDRIFTPFFTTRPVGEGTGLGLYVCRNIVQGMDGEIRVESRVGYGTRVMVLLPAARTPAEVSRPPPSRSSGSHAGHAVVTDPPLRLLLVEDDRAVLQALARYLRPHEVRTAVNGREALALCEKEAFDLVLSDVMMPQMTGVELAEALAARGFEPQDLVLMTGGAFSQREQRWIDAHRERVLDKPLDLRRLDELLRAAADRRAQASAA